MNAVTEPDRRTTPIQADPDLYDSPRAVGARRRGLDAPFITGGEDPHPAEALAEERKYGKLLLAMVITIVGMGFVVGTILALAGVGGLGGS
jgi:hypothetical protein